MPLSYRQRYLRLLEARSALLTRGIHRDFRQAVEAGVTGSNQPSGRVDEFSNALRNRLPGTLRLRLMPDGMAWANATARYIQANQKDDAAILDELVQAEIANAMEAQIREVTNEVIRNRLAPFSRILEQAAQDGVGDRTIIQRLMASGELGRGAARRISRTEMCGALNRAAYQSIQAMDPDLGRLWISSGRGNVRPTHQTANGQKKYKEKPFDVGGFKLRWPGDRGLGAPGKETINCACSVIPDV